ncbi:MAG: ATP-binding cassette domain-containing protein [Aurantimonas endophytica]|uniref:Peptide/nickel transport system ATP-binding protein n=1 Tax=Aurantimonas endophytica TaxID=1522175 RepID=A0A7W6MRU7_9HYPH|nr:ATP-binding cassette domain-containing protein [Aurantimonas endophytica]MBB4005359.1 peptide/nickel transport system ATP-binding protein [Aurantimonas endophytica]MCO6405980.1 ATP-binding cassette domain-containing protein [Aurantimonas endophytica]
MNPVLTLEAVSVHAGPQRIVAPASLDLVPGRPLTIIGETGSGKSLLAQAIVGNLPDGLSAEGRVTIGDVSEEAGASGRHALWGRGITVLPQEPWLSLDPTMRALPQVAETHLLVAERSEADADRAAKSDLASVGLSEAVAKYPFQLSGGMAQRLAFVVARAGGAPIVIADEPTKGLDAARIGEVVDLLRKGLANGGALLIITHDVEVARRLGGEVAIMLKGEIVERGEADVVLAAPQHDYTRTLLAADPRHWPARAPAAPASQAAESVLDLRDVAASRGGRTLFSGLSLAVRRGEIVGLTGPSGCGKSTLGDVALGLVRTDAGTVQHHVGLPSTAFQKLYQDPVAAFPPRRTLRRTLCDLAALHRLDASRIPDLMERLRLYPALLDRRPGQVSGGELQRFSLLRVLLLKPALIVADEPSSRLDLVTQKEMIELIVDAADRDGCAIILISHDEALVDAVADRRLRLEGDRSVNVEARQAA